MPSFVLEVYLPRTASLEAAVAAAQRAAAAAAEQGVAVRFVRSLYLEADETCFHVFEGESREAVAEAAARGGLDRARIVETVESRGPLELGASKEDKEEDS